MKNVLPGRWETNGHDIYGWVRSTPYFCVSCMRKLRILVSPHSLLSMIRQTVKVWYALSIKEMGLDEKVYKPGSVQARISNAKNHLVSPAGYASNKEAYEGDCAAKMPAIRDIYHRYWDRCRQADAMDFDDLLFYTFILFRDHPEVLARYQEQFRYILVDEYQDTNYAQHSIVLQLAKDHQHVCVVGE